jgi:putative ABC transport system substrate-binding protein
MKITAWGLMLGLGLSLAGGPANVSATGRERLHRVGVLTPAPAQWEPAAFREALRDLGYVEGQNLRLEVRSADARLDRLPMLASELLVTGVDVIVGVNYPGTRAAMDATRTVPIVMVAVGDAVALGFVGNLARPEGNVTGVTNMAGELAAKRLELLKEAVPRAMRIALLLHPDEPIVAPQLRDLEPASRRLGVEIRRFPVRTQVALEQALEELRTWPADAILQLAGQASTTSLRTAELALKHRIPVMLLLSRDIEAGALMSYFADQPQLYRRAAQYVDRILKGAKVRELPVEQPTKFNLVVNLRTARVMGLTVPRALLLRADKIIE